MQTNELSSHFYTPKKNLAGLPLILMVLHKIYDFYQKKEKKNKKTTTQKQKQKKQNKKPVAIFCKLLMLIHIYGTN